MTGVKDALRGDDAGAIKRASDALQKVWHEEAGKMYAQQQAAGPPPGAGGGETGAAGGGTEGGGPVEADFEVVDEDKKK
jgi:molecular chaperone DnaK